eukprot:757517-Hanusia_phi.AAC.4
MYQLHVLLPLLQRLLKAACSVPPDRQTRQSVGRDGRSDQMATSASWSTDCADEFAFRTLRVEERVSVVGLPAGSPPGSSFFQLSGPAARAEQLSR